MLGLNGDVKARFEINLKPKKNLMIPLRPLHRGRGMLKKRSGSEVVENLESDWRARQTAHHTAVLITSATAMISAMARKVIVIMKWKR